ncbi:HAD-IA family hydrolase [uncultured Umboniibacter sp.]|uniref:HAD-IA family hydrolase n=1 Tax=uncultured Umboniibacter sp. TaxID=1798917 RepID=UPI0026179CAB|nr:HAD-IA family hydrolase [uncultured Umboniibacter sp.]
MIVVYDWDGTLSDSLDAIVQALTDASDVCNLPRLESTVYRSIIGMNLPAACEALYPAESVASRERYAEGYRRCFGLDSATRLYDGAAQHLAEIAKIAGVQLAVATGKSREGLDFALESLGYGNRFVATKTSSDAPSKPSPEMLLQLRSELEDGDVVMIGDSVLDVGMGVAAGAYTIGVTWGVGSREQLLAAGARSVVNSYDELSQLLRQHFNATKSFDSAC